jgi:hypothetical protein
MEPGRLVDVSGPGGTVTAKVADVMSPNVRAKIDLNPAAAIAVGHGGGLTPVSWQWADTGAQGQPAAGTAAATADRPTGPGDITRNVVQQRLAQHMASIPQRALLAGPMTGAAAEYASQEEEQGDRLAQLAMMQGMTPEELQENIAETGGAGLMGTENPQPPTSAFGKYLYTDKEGADIYSGGGKVFPDNSVQYKINDRTFFRANPYAKPVDVSPRLIPTQMQLKDGTVHKVLYDGRTGEIVTDMGKVKSDLSPALVTQMIQKGIAPYDNDGNELTPKQAMDRLIEYNTAHGILPPEMQREVQRITTQVNQSRNPAGRLFTNQYRNYLSAKDNIAIPTGDRTGIDDMFLLAAVAGIENPNRSNTQEDFRQFAATKGLLQSAEVAAKRMHSVVTLNADDPGQGRLLSDQQVKNLGVAVTRGMNSTYQQWLRTEQPGWNRLKQLGLNPEIYLQDQPMYTVPEPGKPGVPIPSPLSGLPEGAERGYSGTANIPTQAAPDPYRDQAIQWIKGSGRFEMTEDNIKNVSAQLKALAEKKAAPTPAAGPTPAPSQYPPAK